MRLDASCEHLVPPASVWEKKHLPALALSRYNVSGEAIHILVRMVKNWDSVKSIIHRLYVTQEQSLDEVRDVMIRQYNFVAS